MNSHDGVSSEMRSGLELPPENWLNEQLQKYKKTWRMKNGLVVEITRSPSSHTQGQGDSQLQPRLSGLLSEGSDLLKQCRSIPNQYQTPVEMRADLANSIVNWSQRAEGLINGHRYISGNAVEKHSGLLHTPCTHNCRLLHRLKCKTG